MFGVESCSGVSAERRHWMLNVFPLCPPPPVTTRDTGELLKRFAPAASRAVNSGCWCRITGG